MRSFYHAGDIGDVIYSLYVMQALGGGKLYLGERTSYEKLQPRVGITRPIFTRMVTLLKSQTYIRDLQWIAQPPFVDYDLNRFREHWLGLLPTCRTSHLLEMNCHAFKVPFVPTVAWLEAPALHVAPVVLARSFRQRNHHFPWGTVLSRYSDACVFVGTLEEHDDFVHRYGYVKHYDTPTLLRLAEVIKGSHLFIGNSSAPLAIAEALKVNVVQETSEETLEMAHTYTYRGGHTMWHKEMVWPTI